MIASIVGGVFGLFFMLIAGLFALAVFVFWIWMLIHAVTNKGLGDGEKIAWVLVIFGDGEKIAWVLVIFFLHFIGALIYFFIGRPKGTAAIG